MAKKLEIEWPGIRFCPDEWMESFGVTLWDGKFREQLEEQFWHLSQQLLALGNTVILEYGFWAKAERDEKLAAARKLGVNVELHYLDVPMEELKERLAKRGMEGDDVILAGKLEDWWQQFERPTDDELKAYDNYA